MTKDETGIDMRIDLVDIAKIQAVQGEKIESIESTCSAIKKCLLGNGKPGLVTRTDRLEQKDAIRGKLFWIVVTVAIGLLVKAAFPEMMSIF